jgi:uncharacterized protein YjaZ
MPDHCHQSTSDSASLNATSTDSKFKVILNPTEKDVEVNKCKISDEVVNQSKLQTRNSNRLKKQPVSKTDDFFMVVTSSSHPSEITKDESCLSFKCSNLNSHQTQRIQTQSDEKNSSILHQFSNLIICHQNIRRLSNKIDEVINSFSSVRPHISA